MGESSTGVKSTVIHTVTSVNIFEVSKRDNPQYCVDVEARIQDSMVFHTQLRIIFDEGPAKHSAVLCARENVCKRE